MYFLGGDSLYLSEEIVYIIYTQYCLILKRKGNKDLKY